MVRTLLVAIAAVAQVPSAAPPRDARAGNTPAAISGRITDRTSGQPIARAVVTAAPVPFGGDRRWVAATADANGRYEIAPLDPGQYIVTAGPPEWRASHLRQAFGDDSPVEGPDEVSTHLELKAGDVRTGLDVALARALAIEGRVLDVNDEPMAEVEVRLLRADGTDYPARGALSDDRGEFRLFGLPPGRYHVCARPREYFARSDANGLRYVRTCHLASTRTSGAADVVLTTTDAANIDIRVQRSSTYAVSGSVIDARGLPADGAFVGTNGSEDGTSGHSTATRGRFVVNGLAPGRYLFSAGLGGPMNPSDSRPWAGEREVGYAFVEVGEADVSEVTLNLSKPQKISGRIIFDGSGRRPSKASGIVIQTSVPLGEWNRAAGSRQPHAPVDDRWSFQLAEIYHVPLIVGMYGLPDGWVLKSVRYGGADITDQPTDLAAEGRARPLEITITDRVARPVVRITDDGRAVKRAWVLLLPSDPARWKARRYGPVQTPDRDGTIKLAPVLPGDYLVAALIPRDHTIVLTDPERIESLAAVARRVTIAEKNTTVLDVPLVSLPRRP